MNHPEVMWLRRVRVVASAFKPLNSGKTSSRTVLIRASWAFRAVAISCTRSSPSTLPFL